MTRAPAAVPPEWTEEDMELLELLLERAALEVASRTVMTGIEADQVRGARGRA